MLWCQIYKEECGNIKGQISSSEMIYGQWEGTGIYFLVRKRVFRTCLSYKIDETITLPQRHLGEYNSWIYRVNLSSAKIKPQNEGLSDFYGPFFGSAMVNLLYISYLVFFTSFPFRMYLSHAERQNQQTYLASREVCEICMPLQCKFTITRTIFLMLISFNHSSHSGPTTYPLILRYYFNQLPINVSEINQLLIHSSIVTTVDWTVHKSFH